MKLQGEVLKHELGKLHATGQVLISDPVFMEKQRSGPNTVWFYLVMDIHGKTLDHFVEQLFGKVDRVLQIGIQTIDRLKVIHEAGLVHNDLKPDKITLGSYGAEDGI
jgi:serine/threonine protein kinase